MLDCLFLNTRLGRKGLPGTNTLAFMETVNYDRNKFYDTGPSGQYYKVFTAAITPLAAYFSMILTELRR